MIHLPSFFIASSPGTKKRTIGYILLSVVFALRWQLNTTQVKCTFNANDSTYIPLGFSIKIRNIRVLYYEYANAFKEIDIFIGEKHV